MCNPALIPVVTSLFSAGGAAAGATAAGSAIATGVALAGTALQVVSTVQQGRYEAAAAKQNARLADDAAIDASRRGAIEEESHRADVRRLLGSQRATFGANNVDSNTGSPLDVLAETAQTGEFDALTIRNNAAREVFGYRTESSNARARAKAAKQGATLGAFGTALTGGAQAYGIWNQEKRRA